MHASTCQVENLLDAIPMRFLADFLLQLSVLALRSVANNPLGSLHNGLLSLETRSPTINYSQLLPPPSCDPWFTPPTDWRNSTPGAVLSVRKSAYKSVNVPNAIDVFQVMFRTTDTNNNSSWATTSVLIPASQANCSTTNLTACSHGIITYLLPYDSADPDAIPSYLLQWGDPYGEISNLLARGWWVSTPDYEGPQSSYCAGVQAGHATLDSIRAVGQVAGQFGFRSDVAKFALWGYSGGAQATMFAAELAGHYAPELNIAGIVAGGVMPNLTTVGPLMTKRDTAGLLIAGIVGITSQHAAAREYMMATLKKEGPHNVTGFMAATQKSGVQSLIDYMWEDVYDYFVNGSADVYSPVMMEMYAKDATMGSHGVPTMPMFIYKAIQDEMSPANETDDLIDGYCGQGANILYHRNTIGGHNQELWAGRARVMDYLSTVLDGANATSVVLPESGCSFVNVSIGNPALVPNRKMAQLIPATRLDVLSVHSLKKRHRWSWFI